MVTAARGVLEVADEPAAARVDAEEVVHVEVRWGVDLGPALGDDRDRIRDTAEPGARPDATAGPVDPRLEGEVGGVEPGRLAKRCLLGAAVEGKRGRRSGLGGRCAEARG